MCKEAGIQGYKTNHSLRATAATRLYASGVDEQLVMERTGHCSTEGIRSYKRTSTEQQQDISDILNNSKRSCSNAEVVQHQLSTAIVPQQPTQLISSSTNSVCIPNITDSSSSNHSGSFYPSSCSNITLNFNYNMPEAK